MSTKTAEIRARVTPEVKRKAGNILKKIGLSESEAVRLLFDNIILYKGLPLQLRIPNEETLKALKEVEDGGISKGYASIDEMFEDLDK